MGIVANMLDSLESIVVTMDYMMEMLDCNSVKSANTLD